ncbi:unknown [Leyella stercorea CAG:629]|uniref:Uncharacterized protein n=1 Tax=Leyella stercorea CAG:629 TaxID=1263103 RepID=R7H879_9BACT|nr:unknown [Leyella stercorea CAG:629]
MRYQESNQHTHPEFKPHSPIKHGGHKRKRNKLPYHTPEHLRMVKIGKSLVDPLLYGDNPFYASTFHRLDFLHRLVMIKQFHKHYFLYSYFFSPIIHGTYRFTNGTNA